MKEILGDAGVYMDFSSDSFPENFFNKIKTLDEVFFESYKIKRENILQKFRQRKICR